MPRLFIAMEADEDIRSSMGKTIKELRSFGDSIRPVDINNLHITLKFIGDTDEKKSLILKKAFENSEIPAGKISCAIRGLGVFPGLVSPSDMVRSRRS
jgi:2'-5' RNA ligase